MERFSFAGTWLQNMKKLIYRRSSKLYKIHPL